MMFLWSPIYRCMITVRIYSLKMTYTGKINHPPKHQELPAVFVDSTLPYMAVLFPQNWCNT